VPVILGRILLRVVTWRQDGHLVPVDRVVVEEVARLLVDLPRAVLVAPEVEQSLVHGPRSQLRDLPQASEDRQFLVRHAHVRFVGLRVGSRGGLQFGGRRGIEERLEDRQVEGSAGVLDEFLKVDFGNRSNGIQLCDVSPA